MTDSPPAKTPGPKKSDLGVRFMSAIVMIAIAGGALWAGGWIFTVFVGLIAIGLLWEWWGLVQKFPYSKDVRFGWLVAGLLYVLIAAFALVHLRRFDLFSAMQPIVFVIATDVGAYFTGRSIGGPKIAPSISPNKTWSGLFGGIVASVVMAFVIWYFLLGGNSPYVAETEMLNRLKLFLIGTAAVTAIVAQSGDFLESWMKRKAGVKDSSNYIPGHGGLLDRADGMLPAIILAAILSAILNTLVAPMQVPVG